MQFFIKLIISAAVIASVSESESCNAQRHERRVKEYVELGMTRS